MHDPLTFEARLADAYQRFLAGAPTDVDPVATAAAAAARRGAWSLMPWASSRSTAALRPLILLIVLGLLAAATAIYIIASARPDPAFGPAGNGLLAYTIGNDLYVRDQQAPPRLVAAGVGYGAQWSRDGSRIATIRPINTITGEIGVLSGSSGDRNYCASATPTCVDEVVITDLAGHSVVSATLAHPSWLMDWSADGRHLLVETRDLEAPGYQQELVLVSSDGSGQVSIGTMFGGLNSRFTASERDPILYLGLEAGQIVLRSVDRDGRPFRDLATTPLPDGGSSVSFDVSPDSSRIAFANDTSLVILRPDGTQERVVPVKAATPVRYSPEGSWLLADVYNPDADRHESILIPADGSASGEPVSADVTLSGCQWAPDGAVLLCFDGGSNGWLVDLETRALTPTTLSGEETQFGIAWQRIPRR